MSLLITKSNKFNHLQNKLLGISYLQIKIMKIWNSKRYYHVFKTCVRQKAPLPLYYKRTPPPGKTLTLSFISRASTFLVDVRDQ